MTDSSDRAQVVSTEKVSRLLRTHNFTAYETRLRAFLDRLESALFPVPTLICQYEPRGLESLKSDNDDATVSTYIDQQASCFVSTSSISAASSTTEGVESLLSLTLHQKFIEASYASPIIAESEEIKALVYGSPLPAKKPAEDGQAAGGTTFFSPAPKAVRRREQMKPPSTRQSIVSTPYPLPRPDHSPPPDSVLQCETDTRATGHRHDASFSSISMSPFTPRTGDLSASGSSRNSDSIFIVSSGSEATSSALPHDSAFSSPPAANDNQTPFTKRTDDVERGPSPSASDFSAVKRLTSDQTVHSSPLTSDSPAVSSVGGSSRQSNSRVTCAANPLDFERDTTLLKTLPSLSQLKDDMFEEEAEAQEEEEEKTHMQVGKDQREEPVDETNRLRLKRKKPSGTTSHQLNQGHYASESRGDRQQTAPPAVDHHMFDMDFDHGGDGDDLYAYHMQSKEEEEKEEVEEAPSQEAKKVKRRHPPEYSTADKENTRPTTAASSASQNKKAHSQSASRGAAPMRRASQRDGNNPFNVATLALYQTAEYHSKLVDVRRKKVPWTAEEEKALLKGVGIYGIGAWMNIKRDPLLGRALKRLTNEQLKDKFRNIQEKRARDGL
eukprot:gene30149-37315_t